MKKYIAVFRSRTDVLSFIEAVRSVGVYSIAVQTPKETNIGCGISAEFSVRGINQVVSIIKSGKFPSFYGFFIIEKRGKSLTVTRF